MEYKVVSAPSTRTLMVRVNELLSEGWELQGGIAYMPSTGTWAASCHQAMVLPEPSEYVGGPHG